MATGGLLSLLVTIVIVGLIFFLLYWFLGQVGLPEPFNKVALVILALAVVIFLIGILTGQVPHIRLT